MNPRLVASLRERARRRLTKPKRVQSKPVAYPHSIELAYRGELLGYARKVSAVIRKELTPVLGRVEDTVALSDFRRALERARTGIEDLPKPNPAATVGKVDKYTSKQLNSLYKGLVGVAPFRADAAERDPEEVRRERIRANVRLIESIPSELLSDVDSTLSPMITAGARVETIAKELQKRFSVAESRAQLIARDQVGKINAQMTESKNRSIGVTRYIWRTSQDERVRGNPSGLWPKGMHYDLNGQTFSYDDPPVSNDQGDRNHPGEDYQCRCTAEPVLEDVLEALGI